MSSKPISHILTDETLLFVCIGEFGGTCNFGPPSVIFRSNIHFYTDIGQFPIMDGLFRGLHLAYFSAEQVRLTFALREAEFLAT
jgi:hypothetical protein